MALRIDNSGYDIIDVCRKIQMECADLFHHFADTFIGNQEQLITCRRLALHYENQSRKYSLLAKYRRQESLGAFTVDLLETEIALIYVQSLLRRATSRTATFQEAFELALELEQKLAIFRLDTIVDYTSQVYASFFTALARPNAETLASLTSEYHLPRAPRPSGTCSSPL